MCIRDSLYLDGVYALGKFAYKLFPVGTEDFVFFGREGLAQATEIFQIRAYGLSLIHI